MTLDPLTVASIDELSLTGRPLIVVDVDEVVVHFVRPLIDWLDRRGLRLDQVSYGLSGNIKYAGTERAVAKEMVAELIQTFFDEEIHAQVIVNGAGEVLGRLAERHDVVLLTNAPHRHRDARRESLIRQGVTLPLLTNEGAKGPPVALLHARAIAAGASERLVFIDDSPANLESVRDHVPDTRLVHFIADDRFRGLARDVTGTKLKTGDWLEVERYVTGAAL